MLAVQTIKHDVSHSDM